MRLGTPVCVAILLASAFAQDRSTARSMVITRYGIVATSHVQASVAGAQILARGGNAVDAAIAANATLGVTEPMMNGIGGDLFAIYWDAKTGKLYGLNSSGWAPQALTPAYLKSKGLSAMPAAGINTVTVPGAVAGWNALHHRFGKLPWSDLFHSAIFYAGEGYPVPELIHGFWEGEDAPLSKDPESARVFLPNGKPPDVGQIFSNPDLAKALRLIADQGADAYYKRDIARAILETEKDLSGPMAANDLADFQPEWVEPISTTYRGWTVTELPPNGQGLAVLSMLNIMERYPLAEYGHDSARALHVMIEAKKLAYSDLLRYVGDPHYSKIPVSGLTSKAIAEKRAQLIDEHHASCAVTPTELSWLAKLPGADTIYMSAIDRDGNIVSLIQSNYGGFGSGVVPNGGGFAFQNRAALFSLERGHPNALAPRKRPLHTIIPAFLQKGETFIGFGIRGGWNQAQAHAQFVSNVVDFGMNVQAALEAPRFTKGTFEGCDVSVEPRIPADVIRELEAMGHKVTTLPSPYSGNMGGGQAVMSAGGIHFAGSDPRKDGAAVPENPAFEAAK